MDRKTKSEHFINENNARLAKMLMLARNERGISQEKLALELGIAKKTVQNWEKGLSTPSLPQAIAWFRVLGVAAMPYFIQFMFPDIEGTYSDDDEALRANLISIINVMPSEGIRQLMYLFNGDHGSSPRGIMNMVTAHLQTPMKERYSHATTIINDYKIAIDKNQTTKPCNIKPNIDLLEKAIEEGRKAVINDRDNYILTN